MKLFSLLKRLRILHPFNRHEIIDAETENVMRDHTIAMSRVTSNVDTAQVKLLESIQHVRKSSESVQSPNDPMAKFLQNMRSSGQHQHRRN
jgi:hypothetical protein